MSAAGVNDLLRVAIEAHPGLRVISVERSASRDAIEAELELRLLQRGDLVIGGPEMFRGLDAAGLTARLDTAVARMRGELVARLLELPLAFSDNADVDELARKRLAEKLLRLAPATTAIDAAKMQAEAGAQSARVGRVARAVLAATEQRQRTMANYLPSSGVEVANATGSTATYGAFERAMTEVDRAADQALHELRNAPTAYRMEPRPDTAPPALYRPPVEIYARCTLELPGGLTVEPGLEWHDGEDLDQLTRALLGVVAGACPTGAGYRELNTRIRGAIELAWPGRAWFAEIHGPGGCWTQVFQPYGLPRDRPRADRLRSLRMLLQQQPDPGPVERTALLGLLSDLMETT